MKKPRVKIVSCDYDGTLASFFDLSHEKGIKKFRDDMRIFVDCLSVIKEAENLDKIYFSLNTRENRLDVLTKALTIILNEEEWLLPGPQFIGGNVYSYSEDDKLLSEPMVDCEEQGYHCYDKLGNLVVFALEHAKYETVVTVTHIEDGKNYCESKLSPLREVGIETKILNLPSMNERGARPIRTVLLEVVMEQVSAVLNKTKNKQL